MSLANVWLQASGTSLGTIQESTSIAITLPVDLSQSDVTFKVITGKLPPGLRIVNNAIVGSAYAVARTLEFKFVIRASKSGQGISDRTFSITVEGPDQPEWLTDQGPLTTFTAIRQSDNRSVNHFYVLDSNYVEVQLQAVDFDTAAGQKLSYFIASGDGTLPPGLKLTDSGLISGFVEPAIIIPANAGGGGYDTTVYDYIAYDFGYKPSNGYDSFTYASRQYDYGTISSVPKKLNRNYQFRITLTDGDTVTSRLFSIFVITDDLFRSDSTVIHVGSSDYTADNSYVRPPTWITASNLGTYRADNYQTFKLDIYEGINLGVVEYRLLSVNLDNSTSTLPPGMNFDPTSGEVFGFIPYQPALSKNYKFTVSAVRYGDKEEFAIATRMFTVDIIGAIESTITWSTDPYLGAIDANIPSTLNVRAESTLTNSQITYRLISGELPPGMSFTADGELIGKPRQYSTDSLHGITTFYETQDGSNSAPVTYNNQTFDSNLSTFDRVFKFVIEAKDNAAISATTREFTVKINLPDLQPYSNVTVRPFLKLSQRESFKSFINDRTVFEVNSIYRPNDKNFGLQSSLDMLVYAGIETKEAADIVSVIGLNHSRKRFKLGALKKAQAKLNGDGKLLYEVVYIEVIDPIEHNGQYLGTAPDYAISTTPNKFNITVDQNNSFYNGPFDSIEPYWKRPDPFNVSLDRTDVFAGDPGNNYRFPSSISIWRKRIKSLGLREPNYLPLWMRTIQDGSVQELGYVSAVPLCYCKPGTADSIILNIKYSGFDFQQLDYEIDRYTFDLVSGYTGDKYFVFRNDRTTIS